VLTNIHAWTKGTGMADYNQYIRDLTSILVANGAMAEDDGEYVTDAFQDYSIANYEDFLLETGTVEREQLLEALEQYYNVKAIDVLGDVFDPSLVQQVPYNVLIEYNCIPYGQDGYQLMVIAGNPRDPELDEVFGRHVTYDPVFFVGIPRHIRLMVQDYYQDSLVGKVSYVDPSEDPDERTLRDRDIDPEEEDILRHDIRSKLRE